MTSIQDRSQSSFDELTERSVLGRRTAGESDSISSRALSSAEKKERLLMGGIFLITAILGICVFARILPMIIAHGVAG